jgi:hypothetical protein
LLFLQLWAIEELNRLGVPAKRILIISLVAARMSLWTLSVFVLSFFLFLLLSVLIARARSLFLSALSFLPGQSG